MVIIAMMANLEKNVFRISQYCFKIVSTFCRIGQNWFQYLTLLVSMHFDFFLLIIMPNGRGNCINFAGDLVQLENVMIA